jgi:DNA-binding CsgD family transcriptional regulator
MLSAVQRTIVDVSHKSNNVIVCRESRAQLVMSDHAGLSKQVACKPLHTCSRKTKIRARFCVCALNQFAFHTALTSRPSDRDHAMPTGTSFERHANDPSDGSAASSHTQESLLSEAARALEAHGNHANALDDVLGAALRYLQWSDGWLLGRKGQAWCVLASRGGALPLDTHVTDPAVLRAIDDDAGLPSMHWRTLGFDVFVPLRFNRRTIGLLVLMSDADAAAPNPVQLASLHTLGVMLAAALLAPAQPIIAGSMIERLTPRERQVFALLPHGLTNIAIAKRLNIAPGTVKSHVERILHKLELADRTQAAVHAARCGWGDE